MKRICVFCGSSGGFRPVYREVAVAVGRMLAGRGIELVYGGGHVGLMGAVADAAMAAGGRVIGIIPQALWEKEVGHRELTELHIVASMHERKAMMADLSDGFLAMPGGFGTFEEFCEALTWAQLGIHGKPCGLLNVDGFYDPLLALFDQAVTEGFLKFENRALVIADSQPETLLHRMLSYSAPVVDKWMDRSQT